MTVSHDEIQRCLNALKASKNIVYDVETSGLDKHRNFIIGYVFTVGARDDETWYLPIRHRDGGNIPGCRRPASPTDFVLGKDDHPLEAEIRRIAEDPSKHWIGHNFKYDLWMSHRHGIDFAGSVEDTRVNAALLDENQGTYTLEACAEVMGVRAKDSEVYQYISDYMGKFGVKVLPERNKAMAYLWCVPGDGPAMDYAKNDGYTTWDLWQAQLAEIERQELSLVHGVEKRVTKTLFRMERRGCPVSEDKLHLVEKKIKVMLDQARQKIPAGMNVRSPKQMKEFCEKAGATHWPYTAPSTKFPTGQPSFPESFLETFPQGQALIRVRKFENLDSTFIEGSVKKNLWKGRVHCDFNQMVADEYGTVSGRLSSSGPNMQQIPKRDKVIAPLLRQIYRPCDDFSWWSADYSQQEYRVFAEYAKSQVVLAAYDQNPRTDYHQLVADLLSVERDPAAKRINLGTIYNMGVAKLAASLGVPIEVAQGYMNKMRQMMPEAREFNKLAQRVATTRGYVKTKLGRRRRFPDSDLARKAGNAVIQGSSADMTKLKMAQIDEYLESQGARSGLILQVHDSLEFEYIEEERPLMEECVRIMCSFGESDLIKFQVPIIADVSTGESWGHATFKKYEEWV